MRKILNAVVVGILTTVLLCGCSLSTSSSQDQKSENRESTDTDITDTGKATESGLAGTPSYDGVQDFSYRLLKNNMDKENPVLSPVSAYIALSMVGDGAENDTLAEFQEVLGEDLLTISADMMNKLPREEDKAKLTLANSAWIDKTVDVNKDWRKNIEHSFRADIYNQELASRATIKKMNEWVEKNTNGLIDQMLEKPLSEDTRLALFNALYFKADWRYKFDPVMTYESDFNLEDGTSQTVAMMRRPDEDMLYVYNDVAEGVVLPYEDENLVFLALKPSSDEAVDRTVRDMYEALTWEDISEFLQQEEETLCDLKLPKFQVEFDESLNDALIKMGLVDAFDPVKADLSGLGSTETGNNLFISLVRQKALVIVDEEGTEAAAVTEVVANETAAFIETEPVELYFDEPFLYMIADKSTNVPLFIGIMDCP